MNNYKSEPEESKPNVKQPYIEPKVLATYKKDDLEKIIKPHGQTSPDGCGCGCS